MLRLTLALPLVVLCSCSYSGYVARSAGDYNEAVESATNNMLAVNVLRARDEAPLSFSDLSQIRGSIASSVAGQASWPFGPFGHDTMRTNSIQAGPISLGINPTFDIAPLNTKQFSEGILQSVSQNVVFYYFKRGTCPSVFLPLLVGSVKEVVNDGHARDGADPQVVQPDHPPKEVELRNWSGLDSCDSHSVDPRDQPQLHFDSATTNVGPLLPGNVLDQRGIMADLAQVTAASIKVKIVGSQVQLYKEATTPVLCVPINVSGTQLEPMVFDTTSVISSPTRPSLPKPGVCDGPDHSASPPRAFVASLRSPQAVFYFLGDILRAEDKSSTGRRLSEFETKVQEVNQLLNFHMERLPPTATRFTLNYRGTPYYVSVVEPHQDGTITIFSILNDLLNLHRDASEIPTTTAVQTVP